MRLINTKGELLQLLLICLTRGPESFWNVVNGAAAIIPGPSGPKPVTSAEVGVDIIAAKPVNDDLSIKLYYQNSLLFVSKNHPLVLAEKQRKKRFGRVEVSEEMDAQAMMDAHADDILTWIGEKMGDGGDEM